MKLLLVYPEIESSNTNTSTYSLPLGLGSIGTYCRMNSKDSLDVMILDGSVMPHREQLEAVKQYAPDVTGINSTIASQNNGYEIGQLAKDIGSLVLFGGVNSTNLWENMLKNRNFIDGVVLYDGEIPMNMILNRLKDKGSGNDSLIGIPNLAHRGPYRRIEEPSFIYVPRLNDIPDIDYSLFDLARFLEQTRKRGFGNAVTYYAGKGCIKRGNFDLKQIYNLDDYNGLVGSMNTCTFCGRNELGLRNLSAEREASIIRNLHEKYSITGFFNVQDTVNIQNASPIGLDSCWFRLFIGAENITLQNIRRLKQRYGEKIIFQAGIESVDPKMRQAYGKTTLDEKDLASRVRLMEDEGIQLHASFILGGRGETRESMLRTAEAARELADHDNVTWILISPQLILPGSKDYKELLKKLSMREKYGSADLIDIVGINRDFLSHFTAGLAREEILAEIKNTFEDIRKSRNKPVLDVKGVIAKEEAEIQPERPYAE